MPRNNYHFGRSGAAEDLLHRKKYYNERTSWAYCGIITTAVEVVPRNNYHFGRSGAAEDLLHRKK